MVNLYTITKSAIIFLPQKSHYTVAMQLHTYLQTVNSDETQNILYSKNIWQ